MYELGTQLFTSRKGLIDKLKPYILETYLKISNTNLNIEVIYDSKLNNNTLQVLLKQNINVDLASQRCNYGPHKDDLIILNHQQLSFKEYASQGQKKTLLFALKLAQFKYLKENMDTTPILLLDDVFEKLDADRIQHLLAFISKEASQTFITDTHEARLKLAFTNENDVQFIKV
jgi:DNA replication and repair protein RecF